MSTDPVDTARLREHAQYVHATTQGRPLALADEARQAADEIDRLRVERDALKVEIADRLALKMKAGVERDAARADAEKWETRANEMGNKFSAAEARVATASATARRDALNEAADEWQRSGVVPVADWLRSRAVGVSGSTGSSSGASDAAPNEPRGDL